MILSVRDIVPTPVAQVASRRMMQVTGGSANEAIDVQFEVQGFADAAEADVAATVLKQKIGDGSLSSSFQQLGLPIFTINLSTEINVFVVMPPNAASAAPSASPPPDDGSDGGIVIIGAAAGGGLVVLVIVLAVFLIRRRFRSEAAVHATDAEATSGIRSGKGAAAPPPAVKAEHGTKEIAQWSTADVVRWVESVGMPTGPWEENDVRGSDLIELTMDDLTNGLGLTKIQAQRAARHLSQLLGTMPAGTKDERRSTARVAPLTN